MPRKPKQTQNTGATASAETQAQMEAPTAAERTADQVAADASADPMGPNERPKNWGPPYKAIYTNAEKGFELGEDRRFKQRVFKFNEKPDDETLAALKDAGFRFRPEDRSWTIQADASTRELSDRLAREIAGTGRSR